MSKISREIYNKMNTSHIFNSSIPEKVTINVKPIKIELKNENNPKPKPKKNVYKPFINKKNNLMEKLIKRNYNESDIFFAKTLTPRMQQKLKDEVFPKKEKYISNYKPENYVKFPNSSFDKKMHDLYKEKGDKYSENKIKEIGKPKKVLISSKGYSEYIEKYNNENYTNYINFNRDHNLNHKKTEKIFYNKEEKYKPNSTSTENYNREFESDIFNIKNSNYSKYMNLNKPKKKMNKSVEINKPRNINVKGALKWPANLNWDQNNEVLFKTHIKDKTRNKSMTAYDRNHIDSVRNLIEGDDDEKDDETNKDKKSGTKKKTMYKRPSFDKKGLGLSRAQKLKNNYSILEDPKEYQNNVRLNNVGNKYEVKEYNVLKSGNIDIFEFEKLIKDKGIHLIELKEKNDFLKNQNKNEKDRVLQLKIRVNLYDKKKSDKLQSIEKELKKKNRQIQIRPAPKPKNHRLKSADYIYGKNGNKNKKNVKL